ncbi:GNAT family N-acetyltransferase [uncultured Photobacterium sp.]|uniref:GNAT family N-acetyltransferase n=1 Tax=uncultured Photobacterium sp. TaxID=173973 RepID=UPI002636FE83|nr:GNAT family N-acetyltransferase [uncultured Photobacterium sp.]
MIRKVEIEDADHLLALMYRLDEETKFMLLEPGERKTTVKEQVEIISSFIGSDSKQMFVAEANNEIVGFIVGIGNTANRNKHSIYCVIGIQQSYCGKGIGKKLLSHIEKWAKGHDFTRIELTVMEHNEHAKQLYLSQGFEVEGTKRNSLFVDGAYVNEYYMSKLLAA